jgi:uncharacterized protein (DUF2336 family)
MKLSAIIVDELESALKSGSTDRRMEVLQQITDLFVITAKDLSTEQIALFDDVIGRLASEIESKALAELSRHLAPISNAPGGIVRRLAWDDAVEVAGPVLATSERLTEGDLVGLAESKGQEHLAQIAVRATVSAPVTDILVERGNSHVASTVADNSGARFSETGFWQLVMRAEGDDQLSQAIAGRSDIPPYLFRQLVMHATDKVKEKLLALADPDTKRAVTRIMADMSAMIRKNSISRDYAEARLHVRALGQDTDRIKSELLIFAEQRKLPELIAALSLISAIPIDLVERLIHNENVFGLLVLCRAAALDWATVHAVIMAPAGAEGARLSELGDASAIYMKLTGSSAQRALRFWQVNKRPAGEVQPVH